MPVVSAEQLAGASRQELVVVLSEQVAVLSEQVAALSTTSRTSSKPPSDDGCAKASPTSRRTRSGRRPGGQPGSAGTTLRQVADPDVVVEHAPGACGGCGASLAGAPTISVARHQVADLPAMALSFTEHQVASRRCGCGHVTAAEPGDGAPAVAVGPAQYGPGVRAVATWLVNAHFLPAGRAAAVMGDVLSAPVSSGSVAAWHAASAAALTSSGGFTDTVAAALRGQDVVHADETVLRVEGALAWVHVACAAALSLFTVHTGPGRRGRVAIDAAGVLGEMDPGAVLVTDAWAPYLSYDTLHALCGGLPLVRLTPDLWGLSSSLEGSLSCPSRSLWSSVGT